MKHRKNKLIREFSEFNLQRMNSDNAVIAMHVDDPQLSTSKYDRQLDLINQSIAKLNNINKSLGNSRAYANLKKTLTLQDQEVSNLAIKRIVKNGVNYDVYLSFKIKDIEYWGVVYDILDYSPEMTSEAFKDHDNLYLSKEWIVKTRGLIIASIKNWLLPSKGKYELLNDWAILIDRITGKMIKLEKGSNIDVVGNYDNKIIIKSEGELYDITGDTFIYFNWWFDKLD